MSNYIEAYIRHKRTQKTDTDRGYYTPTAYAVPAKTNDLRYRRASSLPSDADKVYYQQNNSHAPPSHHVINRAPYVSHSRDSSRSPRYSDQRMQRYPDTYSAYMAAHRPSSSLERPMRPHLRPHPQHGPRPRPLPYQTNSPADLFEHKRRRRLGSMHSDTDSASSHSTRASSYEDTFRCSSPFYPALKIVCDADDESDSEVSSDELDEWLSITKSKKTHPFLKFSVTRMLEKIPDTAPPSHIRNSL